MRPGSEILAQKRKSEFGFLVPKVRIFDSYLQGYCQGSWLQLAQPVHRHKPYVIYPNLLHHMGDDFVCVKSSNQATMAPAPDDDADVDA